MKPSLSAFLLLGATALPVAALAQAPATAPAGAPAAGQAGARRPMPRLALTTTAWEDGGIIPFKYSMAATPSGPSPHLEWTNVADGTVSFAIILHDPDTSMRRGTDEYIHWLAFNIPGDKRELPEGVPTESKLPDGTVQPNNSAGKPGYIGMGAGANGPLHHYTIELFALDTKLGLGPDATEADMLKAMNGHVLGKAAVVGRFKRPN